MLIVSEIRLAAKYEGVWLDGALKQETSFHFAQFIELLL